jgi:hypothetical protein
VTLVDSSYGKSTYSGFVLQMSLVSVSILPPLEDPFIFTGSGILFDGMALSVSSLLNNRGGSRVAVSEAQVFRLSSPLKPWRSLTPSFPNRMHHNNHWMPFTHNGKIPTASPSQFHELPTKIDRRLITILRRAATFSGNRVNAHGKVRIEPVAKT